MDEPHEQTSDLTLRVKSNMHEAYVFNRLVRAYLDYAEDRDSKTKAETYRKVLVEVAPAIVPDKRRAATIFTWF